jgi:hypothetical protein
LQAEKVNSEKLKTKSKRIKIPLPIAIGTSGTPFIKGDLLIPPYFAEGELKAHTPPSLRSAPLSRGDILYRVIFIIRN